MGSRPYIIKIFTVSVHSNQKQYSANGATALLDRSLSGRGVRQRHSETLRQVRSSPRLFLNATDSSSSNMVLSVTPTDGDQMKMLASLEEQNRVTFPLQSDEQRRQAPLRSISGTTCV